MIQITLEDISGYTLPVEVYISDIYENNVELLGFINNISELPIEYILNTSSIFINIPQFKIILKDSENCEKISTNTC